MSEVYESHVNKYIYSRIFVYLVCSDGFTGMNCEINIDDCATNPCVNGTCIDVVNGYNCTCDAGFTGFNCDTNIGVCDTIPCVNGACVELVSGYNCTCQEGYTGTSCDFLGDVLTVTLYSIYIASVVHLGLQLLDIILFCIRCVMYLAIFLCFSAYL